MARHLHLAPDARHLAVGSDQEGGPFDAHVFAAIEALFHPHAIGLQHPSFGIAAEHHLQAMLAGELLMARSEEHTSELQSLMRISYAVFFLKKKTKIHNIIKTI